MKFKRTVGGFLSEEKVVEEEFYLEHTLELDLLVLNSLLSQIPEKYFDQVDVLEVIKSIDSFYCIFMTESQVLREIKKIKNIREVARMEKLLRAHRELYNKRQE